MSLDLSRTGPGSLATYARWRGAALARVRARSGDRIAIASYLAKKDTFDGSVAAFATDYADLNADDHAALRDALRGGRLATS